MKKIEVYREKIFDCAKILEQRLIPNDISEYKIMFHDFSVINDLLRQLGKTNRFGVCYKNPFKKYIFEVSKDELDNIVFDKLYLPSIPYTIFSPKVDEKKLEIIFCEFLKNTDIDLYNIYINLLSENMFFYCKKKQQFGCVQYLINFNKFFVNIKNNKFKHFTLIHELGHIKQIKLCEQNINSLDNLYKSLFTEVYSKYVEIKWCEYLKKQGYMNIGLKWEENFLTCFSIYCEKIIDLYKNKSKTILVHQEHFLKNYIGYLLAVYLKDIDFKELDKLNKSIVSKDNETMVPSINKELFKEDIIDSIKKYYSEYCDDFKKQKVLKKQSIRQVQSK